VLAAALLIELLVLFANTISRSFLAYSLPWAQEVAGFALTVITFLGSAVAYRRGGHMAVQAVVQRLPPRLQEWVRVLVECVVAGVSIVIFLLAASLFETHSRPRSPVLGVSQNWTTACMCLGMLLTATFAIVNLTHQRRRPALGCALGLVGLAALVAFVQQFYIPTPEEAVVWVLIVFVVLLALGVPIGFVFAWIAILYLYESRLVTPIVVPINLEEGNQSFLLLAVPFFIMAGLLMTAGGLTLPLAEFAVAAVGRLRGGLLQVVVVTMYVFSGISGSKLADVAAVGGAMDDTLQAAGYKRGETAAVLAASAAMGETIPPSIGLLVLGSITSLSISGLFLAGLLPAAVIAICLMVLIFFRAPKGRGDVANTRLQHGIRYLAISGVRALPALVIPVLLVGGIVSGIATPTEVSSYAVVYGLVLAMFVYRKVDLRKLRQLLVDAAALTGMLLFIITTASAFSFGLSVALIPQRLTGVLGLLHGQTQVFIVFTVLALLVMGAVLEGLPAILIFAPLLVPLVPEFGINPLHFGIVLLIAMGIGSFAPPIGIGFYVACAISKTTVELATRPMLPYLAVLVVALLIVALFPDVTLVLPRAAHMVGP
jgi:tripartite ATP-independent transporter DctM subunit